MLLHVYAIIIDRSVFFKKIHIDNLLIIKYWIFMIYKYITCLLMLPMSLIAVLDQHVYDVHCYDPKAIYKNEIANKYNGVMSAINTKKDPKSFEGHRKTLFSKKIYDKNFDAIIMNCAQNGFLLFKNDQKKCVDGRYVEYRQDKINKELVLGIVKERSAGIKTVYPILRYISLQDLANKKPSDNIYIGSIHEEKKDLDCYMTVASIEKASHCGLYLSHRNLENGKILYLVDISKTIKPDFFYGDHEERGSILVETNWIHSPSKNKSKI